VYLFKDMRSRKSVEYSKEKSEQLYRLLAEHMTDVVWIMDRELHFIWLSDSSEKLRGFTNEETKSMSLDKLVTAKSWERAMEFHEKAIREETERKWATDHIYSLDLEMIHKNGSTVWTENKFQIIRDERGSATGFIGWGRDISERRRAEQDRVESEKYFRLLAENSSDVVALVGMDIKPVWISPSVEKLTGFAIEELKVMPLEKLATYDTLQKAGYMYWTALQQDEKGELLPDAVLNLDIEVYRKDGSTLWCECKFRFIRDEKGKAIAIIGQGRDITERKKAEETLEQSFTRLEKTVEGAIAAMATVIEMRDPYTAGHQQRVATIAGAIAREMVLPDDLVKGVEITGKIHDIGKIYVPMEILSKPGILSPIERQIIQTHARGSYDILKSIDFPWPVAQTALQHHERLDGSGYPQGLKENEIMLEAKILMVADVVEAMASHRPYRASRGIEAALDEISRNRSTLYDSNVVDACLSLFREKGFSFEETGVES
jgi:PAS domain S-box-containing protein